MSQYVTSRFLSNNPQFSQALDKTIIETFLIVTKSKHIFPQGDNNRLTLPCFRVNFRHIKLAHSFAQ